MTRSPKARLFNLGQRVHRESPPCGRPLRSYVRAEANFSYSIRRFGYSYRWMGSGRFFLNIFHMKFFGLSGKDAPSIG